jgi:phage antirepressor YoqD-like protein
MNPTVQFLDIVMEHSSRMFDEAISNRVYAKLGMKQNNLSNYFSKKKVVYEDVNVYSETKEDDKSEESNKSFKICDSD